MGYGRSKLAGSLILDAAAAQCDVPSASVRVGQIAGPRIQKGIWNKHEFLPSLIASSLYLGVLPQHLGVQETIDWLPVEDVAELILDIAGVTTAIPVSEISGYFHCVNPTKTQWEKLALVIKAYYGVRIRELVSMEGWITTLEKSTTSTTDADKNPAIKLLDVYKDIQRSFVNGDGHLELDMTRSASRSPNVEKLGPITPDLMRNWCQQWGFNV
ncbi:male sterility protein domain-containing protein [Hirsutella rhossiliensis]